MSGLRASTDGFTTPILPLRNTVLYPRCVIAVNIGRDRSVKLLEEAAGIDRALFGVLAQADARTDDPSFKELYKIGTLARIVQVMRINPTVYTVKLSGIGRFRLLAGQSIDPFMTARVQRIVEPSERCPELDEAGEHLRKSAEAMVAVVGNMPAEIGPILQNVKEPGSLADLIASCFPQDMMTVEDRQLVLETIDHQQRVALVQRFVDQQLEMLKVKRVITDLQDEMGRSEREVVLRQQMREIRQQLGQNTDDDEIDEVREKIKQAKMPPEVERIAKKQLGRISSMSTHAVEWNTIRTYLDWLVDLPWDKTTPDVLNVKAVRQTLDEDHYGLEKVKKRIVEFSAVRQLRANKKGPILLFVGPPGVGKTSLGRSIAKAMGRRYARIALGGVSDEAEIRGHQRTYISSLPGRIIQAIKRAGTRNPVLVLDEVDKIGKDFKGDPAAALLEVLDPEQNDKFVDNYIDTPFDLSQVVFIATANNRETIAPPLLDRMELIEVPGYTRTEKLYIAKSYLVPKQLMEHGLTVEQLSFEDDGILSMVDHYTREAGVRGLERQIAQVCRNSAVKLAEGNQIGDIANREMVDTVLGAYTHVPDPTDRSNRPGVATALAWTPFGGEIMLVEASKMPGKGKVLLTGSLRNVTKESATAAVSYVRSKAKQFMLDPNWIESIDLHVHIPKVAIAKDAPSAGLAVFVAVTSLLLNVPVRPDAALSGEITLRGNLLRVWGIKEKLLAAHRAGIKVVLIPEKNERDLEDVP
ncbi:MAG: endopeptidase La, partial [Polyangiaceae bacterium]|nr:endopeptidase La [Polyangiaceae bacterium]